MWYRNKSYTNRPLLKSCTKSKSLWLKIPDNQVVDHSPYFIIKVAIYNFSPWRISGTLVTWLYSNEYTVADSTAQMRAHDCFWCECGNYWFGGTVVAQVRWGCGTCAVRLLYLCSAGSVLYLYSAVRYRFIALYCTLPKFAGRNLYNLCYLSTKVD